MLSRLPHDPVLPMRAALLMLALLEVLRACERLRVVEACLECDALALPLPLEAEEVRCLGFLLAEEALADFPVAFEERLEEEPPLADERVEPLDLELFERYVELFVLMRLAAFCFLEFFIRGYHIIYGCEDSDAQPNVNTPYTPRTRNRIETRKP